MNKIVAVAALLSVASSGSAGLVARWDFNNYDPSNPTSANVLKATVGDDGYACYYNGKGSALVGGDTLGQMYVACADSTDTDAITAFNALGGGNYALAIPSKSHVALPVPAALLNQAWTMKIRCWIPAQGWHTFFNRSNTTDADLFITAPGKSGRSATGIGGGIFWGAEGQYKTNIGIGSWQTVIVSAGPTRTDLFLNETTQAAYANDNRNLNFFSTDGTEAFTTHNGKMCLLLCADEDGEDGLMYIDYVEFFDDASAYEGKAPQYTKDGLTGEWTFAGDNPLKATVGKDLEYYTRTGSVNFENRTDGVVPGDNHVRKGQNNAFKCYHGLPANSSYTVVMDIRVADGNKWHALFQPRQNNDGDAPLFLVDEEGKGTNFKFKWANRGTEATIAAVRGEWRRIVITHNATISGTTVASHVWSNGVDIDYNGTHNSAMKPQKDGWFLLLGDNDGEDHLTDISYAAIYDRVLTDDEIKELHSRPLAQRADGTFIPTVAPAGLWMGDGTAGGLTATLGAALAATSDGGYTWTRVSAPSAATYVADLTLPETQTEGGVLVKNASNIASGIYGTSSKYTGSFTTTPNPDNFKDNTTASGWGDRTVSTLDRTSAHRVAVTWTAYGRVHYYVDGRLWGQISPTTANTASKPSAVMNFFNGLGANVTRLAAYDAPLTPDEVAALGSAGSSFAGNAPTVAVTASVVPAEVKAMIDTVSFTVVGTQADGEYVSYAVDWGDGAGESTAVLVPSGTAQTFTHIFTGSGTLTPVFKAISQNGIVGTVEGTPITVQSSQFAASDVLLTWPWQQNVYTNRFTIMCEGVKDADDANKWDGLEVQWGENYANRTTMTRVESNGGTWLYKAHITVEGMDGQTIPYRLGYYGMPLTYTDAAQNTEGTVKLWSQDATESFKVAIWGDNQQGARQYDWDSDIYAYVNAMFRHMVARDVDFGISSGDMASSAAYSTQIQPGVLRATDDIFGRTRPYYVAWGNHDTSSPNDMPYFETGSVDEPGYGTSESGAYALYRGNVLFIFVHQNAYNSTTKTWLANLLATDRAKGAKFRVLVHHYPFYGECWGSLSTTLLDTAKAGGVDIVFSGHMHGYERIEKDGFVQLTNGGAGYLDHVESIKNNYGDATIVGGHQNIPYLWARQQSVTVNDVLGASEPVRMGCIQSYGELSVKGDTLTYTAHGFNADGSYIGVFDTFALKSKTCEATAPTAETVTPCADPSTFAEFTAKPVTNAKWAEYKTAIGEPFTYGEGKADVPVVNVSRTEIEKFLIWLNGETGTYRLPTVDELATAFGGTYAREVSEWTSSVDANTGWCRILGSPSVAVAGTWGRTEDRPAIATPDCHANYLGFRLATGPVPTTPVNPLDAPLAAVAALENPAEVYTWREGALVDVTAEWKAEASSALVYETPVIFTGSGNLSYANNREVQLNGGFAAPKASQFEKPGEGRLTVKGVVKGGPTTDKWGWTLISGGELAFENVVYSGQSLGLSAGDRTLRLTGTNLCLGATLPFGTGSNRVTNFVASAGMATLKARAFRDFTASLIGIASNVTIVASEDLQLDGSYTFWIDGTLNVNGLIMNSNSDPWFLGSGTLQTTYFGCYENSWRRLGVSNVVIASGSPWRTKKAKSYNLFYAVGDTVRMTSLYPWTVDLVDSLNSPLRFDGLTTLTETPKFIFAGEQTVHFNPTEANANLEVAGGTVLIQKLPTTGTTATSSTGAWGIDGTLALSVGQQMTGTFVPGGTLSYSFGTSIAAGQVQVLHGSTLKAGDITVTTDVDPTAWNVTEMWSEAGDLSLLVLPVSIDRHAVWTGEGDRTNPLDPSNWAITNAGARVEGAVPDANTCVWVKGPSTTLNVPPTEGFAYGALVLGENVALAADCDWRGFGSVMLSPGVAIDLCGHELKVAGFGCGAWGSSRFTDTTTDAAHPGHLVIDVAEGVVFENLNVSLDGNLQLVKEGLGTYTANYSESTYSGGTEVRAGTARPGDSVVQRFGANGTTIGVAADATFDLWSRVMRQYDFRLDGATFQNTYNSTAGDASTSLNNFTLTADSTFNYTGMKQANNVTVIADGVWDLGGHTFSVGLTSGSYLNLQGPHSLTNGTLNLTAGGWFRTQSQPNDCRTANFIVNCALNLEQPLSVRDYTAKYTSTNFNKGTVALNVYGIFTPESACFYGCTMQDGSAIDLSDKTGVWSTTSAFASGRKTIDFADNATITINTGKRSFTFNEKIVAWTTAPTNLDTLTFRLADGTRLCQKEDGLYIKRGFVLIIK